MSNNNNPIAFKKYNFCTTEFKTTTEKFVWTIKNFSELPEKCGENLDSANFISTAPNGKLLKWRLMINPNGHNEEAKDYVSLYLNLIDSDKEQVRAKFQFAFRKSDGQEYVLSSMSNEFHKFNPTSSKSWGVNKLITRKNLFNTNYGLLNGDHLTIVCTLIVQQKSVQKAPLLDVEVPECRGMEDLSNLYEKSLFTDCKITSEDDKEYKVHKCILGCRSPVFGAMFEHEMLERNSNTIEIVDIKGVVIDKMLRFIYSGKEPNLEVGMAEDLLIAADKYELTRLKVMKTEGWKTLADKQLVEQILMAK